MNRPDPHLPRIGAPEIDAPRLDGLSTNGLSLEERLRVIRERCRLMADMFSLQAEAAWLALHVSLSVDAYNALTDLCRASADDLERLSHEIPGAIANWHPRDANDDADVHPNYGPIVDVQAP